MFASFDAVTGAGIAQFNGAAVRTVALALDAASPALGGASAGAAATDARGTPRAPASTDIGAFEEARVFVAPEPDAPSLIVTTTDDAVDTSDRVTSLREAVGVMSDGISEGAIIIEGDQVLTLTAGELVIASAVTINCAASVSAGGASRAMRVDGGGWLEFNGTLLTSGIDTDGAGGGGALVADGGRLTFNGGGVSGSVTASCYGGGGIMVRGGGALSLSSAVISGAAASFGDGGGIAVAMGGALTATGPTIEATAAEGLGGSVSVACTAVFSDTLIAQNAAASGGGGELGLTFGAAVPIYGGMPYRNAAQYGGAVRRRGHGRGWRPDPQWRRSQDRLRPVRQRRRGRCRGRRRLSCNRQPHRGKPG